MAKQGQHRNDRRDNAKSKGSNNPDKSDTIITGTPRKQETYARQAAEKPGDEPSSAEQEAALERRHTRSASCGDAIE